MQEPINIINSAKKASNKCETGLFNCCKADFISECCFSEQDKDTKFDACIYKKNYNKCTNSKAIKDNLYTKRSKKAFGKFYERGDNGK